MFSSNSTLSGSACAGGLTYARYKYTAGDAVRAKRIANAYNVTLGNNLRMG